MPARRILQLGDPMLRAVSTPISSLRESEPIFLDLRDTLHEFRRTHGFGRGISSKQPAVCGTSTAPRRRLPEQIVFRDNGNPGRITTRADNDGGNQQGAAKR